MTPAHPGADAPVPVAVPAEGAPALEPPATSVAVPRPDPTTWSRAGPGRYLLHSSFRL